MLEVTVAVEKNGLREERNRRVATIRVTESRSDSGHSRHFHARNATGSS
jgi:hypothetical protein